MPKVVINKQEGACFGLSRKAARLYAARKGIQLYQNPERPYLDFKDPDYRHVFFDWIIDRADPILVEVVEELGAEANGYTAQLKIVTIPDTIDYVICQNNGKEWIAERHQTWS